MDIGFKAALGFPARTFTLLRMSVPGEGGDYVVRLTNGGQVVTGGETYHGRDATFGSVDSISPIRDGVDAEVTTAQVVMIPAEDQAIETLANPRTQGASVRIVQGAIDTDTGAVFGTDLLFRGEINYSTLVADETGRAVKVELITEEARQLEPNDERRLSHSFHQSVWPGETGLIHATGVTEKDFWRVRKPAGSGSFTTGGGAGGGAGGGGGFNPMVMSF